MVAGLLVLLCCQLLGELVVRSLGVPVPGPVAGMVLLLVVLRLREPARDSGLVRACEGLLRHLQLLFVPAGVGVVDHLALVAASGVPLAVGLLGSWLAAFVATVGTAAAVIRLRGAGRAAR